jgi:hypothetical protein
MTAYHLANNCSNRSDLIAIFEIMGEHSGADHNPSAG